MVCLQVSVRWITVTQAVLGAENLRIEISLWFEQWNEVCNCTECQDSGVRKEKQTETFK